MTIQLKGMTWGHDRGLRSIEAASREWERTHPGAVLTWDVRSLTAFGDQPLAELVGRYDLLVIDHPHVAEAAAAGLLAPFAEGDSPDDADFIGLSQQSYRWNGECWGLAIDAAAQVSVRRKDRLRDSPTDWEQVLDLAAKGRVLWAAKPVDAYASLFTLCAGLSGNDPARGGRFCAPDSFDEAWETLVALTDRVPERCFDTDPIQVAEDLSVSDEHWYAPLAYGYTNYGRAGYREHALSYADIPCPRGSAHPRGSMLGGAGLAVSARSAHRAEAQRFALWVASAGVQAGIYFDGGGQPGHLRAWNDAGVDERSAGFFSATRTTLEMASVRPAHPAYMRVQNEGSLIVWRALQERRPAEQVRKGLDALVATMEETR